MKRKMVFYVVVCFVSVVLNGSAFAQIDATLTGDVRLAGDLDELPSGGQVGDENGGNTSLLIWVNAGSVENVSLIGFDTMQQWAKRLTVRL